MQVKLDERIKSVRAEFCAYEIEHLNIRCFVSENKLPSDWKSFEYQNKVNAGGVPSDIVEERYRERR